MLKLPDDKDSFFSLLEAKSKDLTFFIEAREKRVQFFVVLNTSLFAGCIAGLSKGNEFDVAALLVVPVLVLIASEMAISAARNLTVSFLEAVVYKAKLEQALGLTSMMQLEGSTLYWPEEPMVNTRHVQSRVAHLTSDEFIKHNQSLGYQRVIGRLFRLFQIVSITLILVISLQSASIGHMFHRLSSG